MIKAKEIQIEVSENIGSVSALLMMPKKTVCVYVFAHGAGAGMHHPFMEKVANRLADRNIATLRYQFPYMEKGKRRPDPPKIAIATVKAAIGKAKQVDSTIPVVAGGKSFGGRMTSQAASKTELPIEGMIFLGFPLHAPGRNSNERADHLKSISKPMLFLQGGRDSLAKLELLEPVIKGLKGMAVLKILEGGDHSFKTRKKDGISEEEVMDWIANETQNFIKSVDN
ncbi:MAG: alpha/beta hydrolase [Chitinophagales bacterium]|nr:alpha/beta hydrolase [Chitinophagales bacterium]